MRKISLQNVQSYGNFRMLTGLHHVLTINRPMNIITQSGTILLIMQKPLSMWASLKRVVPVYSVHRKRTLLSIDKQWKVKFLSVSSLHAWPYLIQNAGLHKSIFRWMTDRHLVSAESQQQRLSRRLNFLRLSNVTLFQECGIWRKTWKVSIRAQLQTPAHIHFWLTQRILR